MIEMFNLFNVSASIFLAVWAIIQARRAARYRWSPEALVASEDGLTKLQLMIIDLALDPKRFKPTTEGDAEKLAQASLANHLKR